MATGHSQVGRIGYYARCLRAIRIKWKGLDVKISLYHPSQHGPEKAVLVDVLGGPTPGRTSTRYSHSYLKR